MFRLTIPGEPCAQGRGQAFRYRARGAERVGVRDPAKSRSWKGAAQVHMRQAMGETPAPLFPAGPVAVVIRAVFTCPKGDYRKAAPVERRPHAKRGDADNVAKATMDAATGILWLDDAQVARLTVEKWIGAQGEAPYVAMEVEALS